MSQKAVEIVRGAFEAYSHGKIVRLAVFDSRAEALAAAQSEAEAA